MEYLEWLLMALAGVGSGAYGVLVGAGGGFILSPILLLLPDAEPERVAGTVLAAIAINSALVALTYRGVRVVDYRSGLLFAGAAAPGAVIGAIGVGAAPPGLFRTAFGVLLILLAVQLAVRPYVVRARGDGEQRSLGRFRRLLAKTRRGRLIRTRDGQEYEYEFNEALATSFNVALGFLSGFFGIGGGFLRTPVLVLAFGFPARVAAATSVFALAIYGTAGAVIHGVQGHIEWFPMLVFAGVGLTVGGQIGARISRYVRGIWVLRMLLVVVLALGIQLVWAGQAERLTEIWAGVVSWI